MRVAVKKILKEGFDLMEAVDGEDGWDTLVSNASIQVVISDLSMPNLDGFGLLHRIRNATKERIRNIPVIIITGNEDDEATKQKALAYGATDFVTKPFDSVQLRARVKTHARLDSTTRKLSEISTALQENTAIDPLTRLANQRHFTQKGNEHLSFAKRHRTELSLIRLDLNNFNTLFIKHGKRAADGVLVEAAEILKTSIRQEDTAARIGVAKFALLLPHANLIGARQLARRIYERLAALALGTDGETPVNVSIGVATPSIHSDTTFEEIIEACEGGVATGSAICEDRAVGWEQAMPQGPAATTTPATSHIQAHTQSRAAPAGTRDTPIPDVDAALAMLAQGEEARLLPHLPALTQRLLPLLELCNDKLDLGLEEVIARLKARRAGHADAQRPILGANVFDR